MVVAALGGNALLPRGEPPTTATHEAHVARASTALAAIARDHDLVVTHGNGPQVGLLALRAALDGNGGSPLDVLGAETEGWIGYLLERGLRSVLPGRAVAALLTQVEVDPADPAMGRPTKPIGPLYDEETARRLAAERGWSVERDEKGWRRVVPSPAPRRIVELEAIRLLVDHGVVPIYAGGGGVPVTTDESGRIRGVEAVVDKDATAGLLARQLQADVLLLLTDVDGVLLDYGSADERLLERATPDDLDALRLPAGSMGPKVAACSAFVRATRGRAAIGRLEDAAALAAGDAGTQIDDDTEG
ncbi:MAG: carbamate kinase [Gemmatimonadetes bacterium]|nr:carbamate kinase [Gemmatimonadota bacterium]